MQSMRWTVGALCAAARGAKGHPAILEPSSKTRSPPATRVRPPAGLPAQAELRAHDGHQNAQRQPQRDHGRSAIADKRQRHPTRKNAR